MANSEDSKSTLDKIKEVLGHISQESVDSFLAIIGDTSRKPPTTPPSIYQDVTIAMENAHRDLLQAYLRNQLGVSVKSRERQNEHMPTLEQASEELSQSAIMGNPLLDSQRFDGIDPNVNPAPPLNSEARQEFDNRQREQELEKKMRLGLSPGNAKRFDPKFRPSGY